MAKPGIYEYELEAVLSRSYLSNGSRGFAFEPIVAGGLNSCILHYAQNGARLERGQALLIDTGAEFRGYNADITRVLPVTDFDSRQLKLFDSVHNTLIQAVKYFHLGSTITDINKKVARLIETELLELGLISTLDVRNQNPKNPAFRKFFMHSAAHFLGLDVHDVGERSVKLRPGMVLTLEPGIYVKDWKTGIRLEQDILITGDGNEVLSKDIPSRWEDLKQ